MVLVIRGDVVDMLCKLDPKLYEPFVEYKKGKKALFLIVHRAVYGLIQSPCYGTRNGEKTLNHKVSRSIHMILVLQTRRLEVPNLTSLWHVDDVKISHM